MTFRHGLIFLAVLGTAVPAFADDINDQIISTVSTPPSDSSTSVSPGAVQSVVIETDLWQRIRNGFTMKSMDDEYVLRHQNWYASRPDYWQRMMVRSSKYLHFVVEEVEKRGYPSEIALLPMIESAYNPRAHSHAKAAGMWQFIPSTGTHYGLEQTWWYDGRRDIFAATSAALDYLGMLHRMFGDWQLALAAYNWGEGAVSRAIARNQAKGLPTDYASLKMPAETRNYVPKLMAVRNLLAEPERFGINLPPLENKPYFAVVTTTRHMDVDVAARFADMSVEDFLDLNPAYNQPVIAYKSKRKLLLPLDKADLFNQRLATIQDGLLSWQAHQVSRGETVDSVAARHGASADELRRINRLSGKRLAAGQLLLVPRPATTQLARVETPSATPATAETSTTPAQELARVDSSTTVAQALTINPPPSASAEEAPVLPDFRTASVNSPEREAVVASAAPAVPAITLASEEINAPVAASEEPRSAPEQPSSHVVARGDTAYNLAARYGLSVQELLQINGLRDGRLQAGQRLSLVARSDRAPVTQRATANTKQRSKQYKVRSGDTAFSIARRFSVETHELLRWNGLKKTSVLRPGDNVTVYMARN